MVSCPRSFDGWGHEEVGSITEIKRESQPGSLNLGLGFRIGREKESKGRGG